MDRGACCSMDSRWNAGLRRSWRAIALILPSSKRHLSPCLSGITCRCISPLAQSAILLEIAGKLGLSDKLERAVNQLSGGEWQRVRLAAVILQIHPGGNPSGQLLLLDEPMSGLDIAQQAALDKLLCGLVAAGITLVMSSHDLNHITAYPSGMVVERR